MRLIVRRNLFKKPCQVLFQIFFWLLVNSYDVPVTHVQASSTETRNHGDTFDKLIKENMETFRELFSMISWKIIITSPVLVKGHPFNAFSSAVLSKHWPSIVQNVVNLFNLKNISWIPDAQGFSIPSQNEFGGSLHLTPEGHLEYGQKMARHFILNKRASKLLSLLTDAVGNSFESGARHTEEVGQAPIHLHAFESSKKRSPSVSSLIQVIAEYAVDDISFTIK